MVKRDFRPLKLPGIDIHPSACAVRQAEAEIPQVFLWHVADGGSEIFICIGGYFSGRYAVFLPADLVAIPYGFFYIGWINPAVVYEAADDIAVEADDKPRSRSVEKDRGRLIFSVFNKIGSSAISLIFDQEPGLLEGVGDGGAYFPKFS